MVFDPNRKVLTLNLPVIARFPAIRQQKIEEFKWSIGEWAFENHVRATPSTPAYVDTYHYTYALADRRLPVHGERPRRPGAPYLTLRPLQQALDDDVH